MHKFFTLVILAVVLASGCNDTKTTAPPVQDAKIKENLDKLPAEDRSVAEAQHDCPITSEPLGSMGPPIKLMLNDKPVFVCCKSCEKQAKANPDKTLKQVEALKAKRE